MVQGEPSPKSTATTPATFFVPPQGELRVSTAPVDPYAILRRQDAMPPGKVSVPFSVAAAGYLEYDATAFQRGAAADALPAAGPAGQRVVLSLDAPAMGNLYGPERLGDLRNVMDLIKAPVSVQSFGMHVAPATAAGGPDALRAWSSDDHRVVFDGERFVPVVEVQRRARDAHSRPDYCALNYAFDSDERLYLEGVDVTSALGGRSKFRDVSKLRVHRQTGATEGEAGESGLELGLAAASPEARIVRTLKEVAAERKRRAETFRGESSWDRALAMDDAAQAFVPTTGEKKPEREIVRDTGVREHGRPLVVNEYGTAVAPAPRAAEAPFVLQSVKPPDVFYSVQYVLPTQVPMRPYLMARAGDESSDAARQERWSAWAGAGPDAIYLAKASGPAAGATPRPAGGGERDADAGASRGAADGLFDRPGVRGGGSIGDGFDRREAQFLFRAGAPAPAEGAAAFGLPGGQMSLGGMAPGMLSFAGAGLTAGGLEPGAERLRAMPMSTARDDLVVTRGGGGEGLVKYRTPELSALRGTLEGAGYDLASPPPRLGSEGFEPTSHKRGGETLKAHVTSGLESRSMSVKSKDLGFAPHGSEASSRFGGMTGGVAPSAMLDTPAMDVVGGASRTSKALLAAGGGAMAVGFGGAAVAAATLGGSGSSDKSGGGRSRDDGADRASMASNGSLFLDYSATDRTLYLSRFGAGGTPGERDLGVALPAGFGGIEMSSAARAASHTALEGRIVPEGAGMAAGWTGGGHGGAAGAAGGAGGALGGGALAGGVRGGGGGGLDAAHMTLASGGRAGGDIGGHGHAGGPPLAADTLVKFSSPALAYQLGHDSAGHDVLVYNGSLGAAAGGYPGAGGDVDFTLPIAMERYSAESVGTGLDGNLRVAWSGGTGTPAGVKDLQPMAGDRRPGIHGFPLSANLSLPVVTGLFASGLAGASAQGLAVKAEGDGATAAPGASYRGAIDGTLSGRGPSLGPAQFERGLAAALAGAKGSPLDGAGAAGGKAGAGGGLPGVGGALGGIGTLSGLGGGAAGAGGGAGGGLPGAAGGAGGHGGAGGEKVLVASGSGLEALRGKAPSFSTSVSLAELTSKGSDYGLRRDDLVLLQKSFASADGGSSFPLKAPGMDLVVMKPTTAAGDGAVPESVILRGKRVDAFTKPAMKNPAGASTENKVNLDYELIAREIYKRIKGLAALQRERRADDHMRYG